MSTHEKSVALIGYGESNKAMLRYFAHRGITPVVRCLERADVPDGVELIYGEGYSDTSEELIIRSPAVRPDKIKGGGRIVCEASYALEKLKGYKIGVSGSDGKTTTCTLIHKMLEYGGYDAYLGGNIGHPLIDFCESTTESSYTVAELSSFQLMDGAPCLDTAVLTGITPNHLDWHLDMDEYIGAKVKMLRRCSRAVLPVGLFPELKGDSVVRFTLDKVKGCDRLVHLEKGYICYDCTPVIRIEDVGLRGEFNLKNVMAAIGALWGIVPPSIMACVAAEFKGVAHRMENVGKYLGICFVDSSIDSTPSRTVSTLSAFEAEKTAIILGGYDKCLDYGILKEATRGIKVAAVFGENREKIMECVSKSAKRAIRVNTLEEAVFACLEYCQRGDMVLLSPASASFDMFKNYKERSERFREIIRGLENAKN